MDDLLEPLHDERGVALHVAFDPVEHETDEHIFVERGNKGLVLLPHAHALRLLLDHALEQVVGDAVEVVFHLLAADGAVDIEDKGLVVLHGLEDLQQSLLPRFVGFFAREGAARVLLAAPLNKVVNVLEVVIKGHAVDAAVLGDVVDGDLVERLLQQQMLQRSLQRPLRDLRHGVTSFSAAAFIVPERRGKCKGRAARFFRGGFSNRPRRAILPVRNAAKRRRTVWRQRSCCACCTRRSA